MSELTNSVKGARPIQAKSSFSSNFPLENIQIFYFKQFLIVLIIIESNILRSGNSKMEQESKVFMIGMKIHWYENLKIKNK